MVLIIIALVGLNYSGILLILAPMLWALDLLGSFLEHN